MHIYKKIATFIITLVSVLAASKDTTWWTENALNNCKIAVKQKNKIPLYVKSVFLDFD